MKEIKQEEIAEINAIELQNRYDTIEKVLDKGWDGIILKVLPCESKDYYGKTTFENQKGFSVEVKLQSPDGEIFTQFFAFPKDDDVRSYHQSNLYAFKKKYNTMPKKGLSVEVTLNENGFFEIVF